MIALQITTLGPMSSIPVELAIIMLEPVRHTRLRIALAAENGAQIYEKHDRIIPTLFSPLRDAKLPNAGSKELSVRGGLMRKAMIVNGVTPFSCGDLQALFFDFRAAYSSHVAEIALH